MEAAQKLMKVFPGLPRHFGRWSEENGHQHVKWEGPLTLKQYQDHINGINSLGVIPVNDEGLCQFGSMDIDDHKKDKTKAPIPWNLKQYKKLTDKIKFLKLPLTVFKSKGGGAHCHLILDNWVSAKNVQDLMNVFQYALGYEELEIFPKQTKLEPGDDGSFINLPYFNGNSRVCINFDNKELNQDDGLNYSIKRTVKLNNCLKFFLLKQGKRTQHRNDRTWCAAAFLKKQYPDEWENKVREYNQIFNEPPLGKAYGDKPTELERTILKSHRNKEYNIPKDEISEPPPNLWEAAEEFEQNAFGPGATVQESGTGKEPEPFKVHWIGEEQYKLKNREWLMKGYLKAGNITLLQAPPGSLKTIVGQQMVYCGASGKPFMGHEITETGNGLIICPEEDRNELELRLEGIKQHYGTITNGNRIAIRGIEHVTHLVRFEKGKIYTGKDYESIKKFIKDNNIKYIHMDPLVSFQTGDFDENSNPQMDKYIKEVLIPLARINNGCLIMVHHSRKPQFQKASKSRSINPWESMNESRGASSLPAAARIVITLMPMTEDLWNALYKKLIPENQIYRHVAIIDAKNNYAATNQYPFWCMKQLQEVRTCEGVIVEIPVLQQSSLTELQNAKSVMHEEHLRKSCSEYIPIIERYFPNKKVAVQEVSLHSIAKEIVGKNPNISISKTGEIKKIIDLMKQGFHRAHKVNDIEYIYYYDRWDKVNHKMQRTDTSIKVSLNL